MKYLDCQDSFLFLFSHGSQNLQRLIRKAREETRDGAGVTKEGPSRLAHMGAPKPQRPVPPGLRQGRRDSLESEKEKSTEQNFSVWLKLWVVRRKEISERQRTGRFI